MAGERDWNPLRWFGDKHPSAETMTGLADAFLSHHDLQKIDATKFFNTAPPGTKEFVRNWQLSRLTERDKKLVAKLAKKLGGGLIEFREQLFRMIKGEVGANFIAPTPPTVKTPVVNRGVSPPAASPPQQQAKPVAPPPAEKPALPPGAAELARKAAQTEREARLRTERKIAHFKKEILEIYAENVTRVQFFERVALIPSQTQLDAVRAGAQESVSFDMDSAKDSAVAELAMDPSQNQTLREWLTYFRRHRQEIRLHIAHYGNLKEFPFDIR